MKLGFCPHPPTRLPDYYVENTVFAARMPELVHATSIKHAVAEIATIEISRFTIDVYSAIFWAVLVKTEVFEFCAVIPATTFPKADTAGGSKG